MRFYHTICFEINNECYSWFNPERVKIPRKFFMTKCKYKWQEKQFPITKLTAHVRTDHTAQVRNLVFVYVRKKKKKKKRDRKKSQRIFSFPSKMWEQHFHCIHVMGVSILFGFLTLSGVQLLCIILRVLTFTDFLWGKLESSIFFFFSFFLEGVGWGAYFKSWHNSRCELQCLCFCFVFTFSS